MLRTERQIEVNASVKRVFDLFSDLERCPQWMSNIKKVFRVGDNFTQWIATTQNGGSLNWVAEIIIYDPNQTIAWRSVGGDINAEVQASFTEGNHNTTLLRVLLGYDLPSASTVETGIAATPLGKDPLSQLSSDLERFKRLVEQEASPANDLRPFVVNRVTEELDPEFLKQNSLPSAPARSAQAAGNAEPEDVTLEAPTFRIEPDSDFGRALEQIGRHSDATGMLFHTEPEVASPIVRKEDDPLASPVVTPAVAPKAVNTAAAAPPIPSRPQVSTPLEPRRQKRGELSEERPHALSFSPAPSEINKRSARRASLIYLAFALAAAFFGSFAGFWLASTRKPAAGTPQPTASSVGEVVDTSTAETSPAATPSPRVSEGMPAAQAAPAAGGEAAATVNTSTTRGSKVVLEESLRDWIATTNARDMTRLTAFYVPTVETFYQQRNVKRATVRAEKIRTIEKADVVRINVAEPTINLSKDGNRATMRFRKTYVIESRRGGRRGEVLQELVWQKTDNGWKIVSERDLRVIR